MVTIGISKPEGERKDKISMEKIKRFHDIYHEIDNFFDIEADKKEYDDRDKRTNNGERFACRNYLSDFYSHLTEEQKELIAKFRVVFGSALVEDEYDREYNLTNYNEIHKNFSMKGE
jgi:hypothetical protein